VRASPASASDALVAASRSLLGQESDDTGGWGRHGLGPLPETAAFKEWGQGRTGTGEVSRSRSVCGICKAAAAGAVRSFASQAFLPAGWAPSDPAVPLAAESITAGVGHCRCRPSRTRPLPDSRLINCSAGQYQKGSYGRSVARVRGCASCSPPVPSPGGLWRRRPERSSVPDRDPDGEAMLARGEVGEGHMLPPWAVVRGKVW
jgi:hypothetical protein